MHDGEHNCDEGETWGGFACSGESVDAGNCAREPTGDHPSKGLTSLNKDYFESIAMQNLVEITLQKVLIMYNNDYFESIAM